jgi:hypothetical protein
MEVTRIMAVKLEVPAERRKDLHQTIEGFTHTSNDTQSCCDVGILASQWREAVKEAAVLQGQRRVCKHLVCRSEDGVCTSAPVDADS